MSNRIEYLVKYSVAPPPSRDYYGLKVFQDEVILYLWKISHGPHKAPIIYRAKLTEFDQEKSLQDEICRVFGKYLLKHVNNIAEGNGNTFLTLPKSLIGRISRYLKFTDIVKLSSLSHVAFEVFNTDLVWQILYTRDKKAKISLEERKKILVYSWKQLYKDKQMQTSIKDQRTPRIPSLLTNNAKTNKLLLRHISDAPKPVSNITSATNIMTKKRSESSTVDLVTIPLSKTKSDTRFRMHAKNEKPLPQKKNIKNTSSTFNMNEKNIKKDLIMARTTSKQESGNVSKHDEIFDKQINQTIKSEKYSNKIKNINTKSITSTQENKLKSKTPIASKTSFFKNAVGSVKSSSVLTQSSHSKIRSKVKSIPKKKVIGTKSEIFNTEKALSENPFVVKNDSFDLADLLEASLKNIRSPRSIFDYNFSCIQQSNTTKDILKIRNETQNIDNLKQLKPTRSSVNMNNFSNKIIRGDGILEKLSEKSESCAFSETSNESLVNNKKSLPAGDNKPFSLSEKYMKARAELRKLDEDWRRNVSVSSQDQLDPNPDISFQNKSLTISSRKIDNYNEKFSVPREQLKTSFLLEAYTSDGLENRKENSCEKVLKIYPKKLNEICEDRQKY